MVPRRSAYSMHYTSRGPFHFIRQSYNNFIIALSLFLGKLFFLGSILLAKNNGLPYNGDMNGVNHMGKMTVYHGSYMAVNIPRLIKGKNTKDFGPGFYCTIIREQAERWAKRYDTPMVSTYTVRMNTNLDILEFREMTEEWLDFIIDCRRGIPHSHDIVIGAMANDQIYNYIADYIDGIITRDQFWSLARFKYPTHQINFCTQEALKCLEFAVSEEVTL